MRIDASAQWGHCMAQWSPFIQQPAQSHGVTVTSSHCVCMSILRGLQGPAHTCLNVHTQTYTSTHTHMLKMFTNSYTHIRKCTHSYKHAHPHRHTANSIYKHMFKSTLTYFRIVALDYAMNAHM